jgi:hypothetical protein
VLVAALRERGAASASAACDIAGAMWRLAQGLASARRGLVRFGAPRALVAAMSAHFDEPAVVESASAALAEIAWGVSTPRPGVPWMAVVELPNVGVPLPPGRGEEEG